MLKEFDIFQPVNILDEAYALLYYWVNFDNLEKTRSEHAGNYQHDLVDYNKKFDIISEMYNYIKINLDIGWERIEYFFKERSTDASTFCSLALLWDQQPTL